MTEEAPAAEATAEEGQPAEAIQPKLLPEEKPAEECRKGDGAPEKLPVTGAEPTARRPDRHAGAGCRRCSGGFVAAPRNEIEPAASGTIIAKRNAVLISNRGRTTWFVPRRCPCGLFCTNHGVEKRRKLFHQRGRDAPSRRRVERDARMHRRTLDHGAVRRNDPVEGIAWPSPQLASRTDGRKQVGWRCTASHQCPAPAQPLHVEMNLGGQKAGGAAEGRRR